MKSQIEKSRRRRKLQGKKKYIVIFAAVFLGIPALILSVALLSAATRPLYISPLPFFNNGTVTAATDDDTAKSTIATQLGKQHIAYKRIDTSEQNSYSIQLAGGEIIIVTKNKDIPSQIASLQVIYNRLTMEGKRFKKLDLRFSKPVITF
jgi:hypothetical protein